MCLRGFVVLFLGLVFLLPVAALPSRAPSSSIVPIACVSILPAAHVKTSTPGQPAFGCAAFAPPAASVPLVTGAKRGAVRVIAQEKNQVKNTPLSFGLSGYVGIGTTSPAFTLDVAGTIFIDGAAVETNPLLYMNNHVNATMVQLNTSGNSYINVGNVGIVFTIPDFRNAPPSIEAG